MRTAAAWLLGAFLVATHLVAPVELEPQLVGGWLPEELAYRLVWTAAAFAYLVWFTTRVWRGEDET